jgi:hypothetical protein
MSTNKTKKKLLNAEEKDLDAKLQQIQKRIRLSHLLIVSRQEYCQWLQKQIEGVRWTSLQIRNKCVQLSETSRYKYTKQNYKVLAALKNTLSRPASTKL